MKEGRKSISPHFVLYSTVNAAGTGRSRIGISVPKRAVALATGRNRIKRLVRETWRKREQKKPHQDCVLVVKKGIDGAKNASLVTELSYIFDHTLS